MPRTLPQHSPDDLTRWFPEERPAPEEGTFELGLVLAGAVSAGAYTAGVLDFLYEALDTWYLAKARGEADVPGHDVVLRLITGASAGGMNGAISAAALRHQFPHPQGPGKEPDAGDFRADNPFWRAWVREIDIRPLLDQSDLKDGEIRSLLNCKRLEDIVRGVIDNRGEPVAEPAMRGWIANPLTVLLTVTNLRGVPYQVVFSGQTALRHEMSLHRDHVAFAIPDLSRRESTLPVPAPDMVALPEQASFSDRVWHGFGMTALATGAFPLFLQARRLERHPDHYLYRNIVRENGAVVYDQPAWRGDPDDPYGYVCVDGGAMNNEPFELARTALAGIHGRNPRGGDEANRAVIMVDPFADPGEGAAEKDDGLTNVAGATLGALINQARFTFRDRALIQDERVYSRYMISPSRSGIVGSLSLCSGGLRAFLGFFAEAYRHHDFMLGRRNAQRFLQTHLTLPESNPVLKVETWTDAMRERYRDPNRPDHYQLIPLIGKCAIEEQNPEWPAGAFRMDNDLKRAIHGRVDGVLNKIRDDLIRKNVGGVLRPFAPLLAPVILGLGPMIARGKIKAAAIQSVREAARKIDEAP